MCFCFSCSIDDGDADGRVSSKLLITLAQLSLQSACINYDRLKWWKWHRDMSQMITLEISVLLGAV